MKSKCSSTHRLSPEVTASAARSVGMVKTSESTSKGPYATSALSASDATKPAYAGADPSPNEPRSGGEVPLVGAEMRPRKWIGRRWSAATAARGRAWTTVEPSVRPLLLASSTVS